MEADAEVSLEFRTWGYLAPALPQIVIAVGVAVALVLDSSTWWAWLLMASSAAIAVIRLMTLRQAYRTRWTITINADGVRWNTVDYQLHWAQIAEIRVFKAHGWRRLLPHLDRIALVSPAEAHFARRARSRPIGRPILLSQVDATPQFIIDSLRRFTDAPVT